MRRSARNLSYRTLTARAAWWMVLPIVVIMAIFTLYPYAYSLWTSVRQVSPLLPPKFVGFDNYVNVLTGSYFAGTVRNTLVFALFSVPLTVAFGLAAALLLNQEFRGNTVLRAIVLLPWAIPTVISGVIWKGVFADTWGALNAVLYALGLIEDYLRWLTTPGLAMFTVVVAQVWTQFPMAAILLLASMQSIPNELYDSAAIDGAGRWGRFRWVTFPAILPMLIIVTIYECLVSLTAFDITYGLTGGGPGTATTFISYYTWAETFRMLSFGTGAALAVIIALAALGLILLLLRAMPADALVEE